MSFQESHDVSPDEKDKPIRDNGFKKILEEKKAWHIICPSTKVRTRGGHGKIVRGTNPC
jgi:hypothetical protein